MTTVGGGTEGGRIAYIQAAARRCAIQEGLAKINNPYCAPINSPAFVQSEGAYIAAKQATCSTQTITAPIYVDNYGQQVPGPSSSPLGINTVLSGQSLTTTGALTQSARIARIQQATLSQQPRFASYKRWTPPPCPPPLPALANSAGQAKPSVNSYCPNKNAVLA